MLEWLLQLILGKPKPPSTQGCIRYYPDDLQHSDCRNLPRRSDPTG